MPSGRPLPPWIARSPVADNQTSKPINVPPIVGENEIDGRPFPVDPDLLVPRDQRDRPRIGCGDAERAEYRQDARRLAWRDDSVYVDIVGGADFAVIGERLGPAERMWNAGLHKAQRSPDGVSSAGSPLLDRPLRFPPE